MRKLYIVLGVFLALILPVFFMPAMAANQEGLTGVPTVVSLSPVSITIIHGITIHAPGPLIALRLLKLHKSSTKIRFTSILGRHRCSAFKLRAARCLGEHQGKMVLFIWRAPRYLIEGRMTSH